MIDIAQAGDYLRALANKSLQAQQAASLAAGMNGLALIKKRVIGTGVNSDGKKFKDYSQVEVPIFFFNSRTGGNAPIEKLKKKKKAEGGTGYVASYEDFREVSNLQTKHKDFKFSGRMWANIKPLIKSIKNGKVVVEIGADNDFERKKVGWNIEEDGNFLKPNKQELDIIRDTYNNEFVKQMLK